MKYELKLLNNVKFWLQIIICYLIIFLFTFVSFKMLKSNIMFFNYKYLLPSFVNNLFTIGMFVFPITTINNYSSVFEEKTVYFFEKNNVNIWKIWYYKTICTLLYNYVFSFVIALLISFICNKINLWIYIFFILSIFTTSQVILSSLIATISRNKLIAYILLIIYVFIVVSILNALKWNFLTYFVQNGLIVKQFSNFILTNNFNITSVDILWSCLYLVFLIILTNLLLYYQNKRKVI